MRSPTFNPLAILLIAFAASAAPAQPATRPVMDLRIVRDGWGDADLADVEAVLKSAGREMLRHFPDTRLGTLEIHPRGGPITLFARAKDGAIVIKLATGDRLWAQYSFQFAHELCHVLCRYTKKDSGNKWFEESLCETASLFVLRQMGRTWKTDPPYRNWKSYAPNLAKYADDRLAEFKLPDGATLAQWYRQNAQDLRKNATDRKKNGMIASRFLPLFEENPKRWAAVETLNQGVTDDPQTFEQYLQAWHDQSAKEHRDFILQIARMFEIKLKT